MTQRFFLWLMSGVLSALIVGCSSAPKPLPSSVAVRESKGVLSQDKRQDVVIQSMAMLDRNYTYGGKKLHTGFDCSGLVSFVYKQSAGVALQGSAADMAKRTRPIDAQSAQPGDLVFSTRWAHPIRMLVFTLARANLSMRPTNAPVCDKSGLTTAIGQSALKASEL